MRYAFVVFLMLASICAWAQDDAVARDEPAAEFDRDDDAVRCIRSTSIRRTRAIDDSTLAFYVGNRVYINYLPQRCSGLARSGRFAFESSGGRVCRQDRIAVIYDTGGVNQGLPCPLGNFHRADGETVDLMLEAAQRGGASSPVRTESVELPPEDETDREDSQRGQ